MPSFDKFLSRHPEVILNAFISKVLSEVVCWVLRALDLDQLDLFLDLPLFHQWIFHSLEAFVRHCFAIQSMVSLDQLLDLPFSHQSIFHYLEALLQYWFGFDMID